MFEWLRNAWEGWIQFTDQGKLAALLIAALIYLFLSRKQKGPQGRLVFYSAIATVLCIVPFTASALMGYQTKFYDYRWIWNVVPMTAVIALGGTLFLTEHWKEGGYRAFASNLFLTGLCVAVLLLCGGLSGGEKEAVRSGEREAAWEVLHTVRELCAGQEVGDGQEICLWAPREILEYARVGEDRVCLLYGRNMWDVALNAYSYDVYSEELQELYKWMEERRTYGVETTAAEGKRYVEKGFSLGADCILLPGEMKGWTPVSDAQITVKELDDYYLVIKAGDAEN